MSIIDKLIKILDENDGKKKVVLVVFGFVFIILIFISLIFVLGKKTNFKFNKDSNLKDINLSSNLSLDSYNNVVYSITSGDNLRGIAKLKVVPNPRPIKVDYYLHFKQELSSNKKCFEGYNKSEKNCRWIDFYNYAVALGDGDEIVTSGRLYPIFCSSLSNINLKDKLYDIYNSCWDSKYKRGFKYTDRYFIMLEVNYKSIDEFLKNNVLEVFDAKDFTIRNVKKEGNKIISTERILLDDIVAKNQKIKKINLKIQKN